MKPLTCMTAALLLLLCLCPPRGDAQTQAELSQRAAEDAAKADKALNAAYQDLLKRLDAEGQEKLRNAQQAWITFRDSEAPSPQITPGAAPWHPYSTRWSSSASPRTGRRN